MEVEIRSKCDHEKVVEQLENMGFEFTAKKTQDDYYYKKKGEEKSVQRPGSWITRVRHQGNEKMLGMKILTKVVGSWEEYESKISDAEQVMVMLDKMGLTKVLEINKTRLEAKKNNVSVCVDDVKQLGTYIEAEVITNDVADGKKQIHELFNALGISEDDYEHKGYAAILSQQQGVRFEGTG